MTPVISDTELIKMIEQLNDVSRVQLLGIVVQLLAKQTNHEGKERKTKKKNKQLLTGLVAIPMTNPEAIFNRSDIYDSYLQFEGIH